MTTLIVLVAVVVGGVIWWTFFRGPSSTECTPVRDMLSFNKSRIEDFNAHTHDPKPGSGEQATGPSSVDYRGWADGLADRAAKVSEPGLAEQARQVAETADRLVRSLLDFEAQAKATAPGAAMPPAGMAVTAFNEEFEAKVSRLAAACPA